MAGRERRRGARRRRLWGGCVVACESLFVLCLVGQRSLRFKLRLQTHRSKLVSHLHACIVGQETQGVVVSNTKQGGRTASEKRPSKLAHGCRVKIV